MERAAEVRWSTRAESDLRDIYSYIAAAGAPLNALNYAQRIEVRCNDLAYAPASGRLRPEFAPNMRSIALENVVVFYDYSDGVVALLRIVHAARDHGKLFRRKE